MKWAYNKENNSHCQLIKRTMRIAFAIHPRMNAMRDRSRYNGDRSLLRAGSPFGSRSSVSLPPHFWLPFVSCNGVHWSWQHFSPLLSLCPAVPLRQWDSASRYEWILPSPGTSPSGWKCCRSPARNIRLPAYREYHERLGASPARSYFLQ